MLNTLKLRYFQGKQFIADPENIILKENFRGIPILNNEKCDKCNKCISVCPSKAIGIDPLQIDMGKCVFCGDCERSCTAGAITFTNGHKLATTERDCLIIKPGQTIENYIENAFKAKEAIYKMFKQSLKLRQVSAGGCNGCEMELGACSNANFDMGRYGIEFVASPRHADGIVISGTVNINMGDALESTIKSIPDPKIIILVGTCAISGGVFQNSEALKRDILKKYKINIYIPGCPMHPLAFISGIRKFLCH